jgi:hypothetical protein
MRASRLLGCVLIVVDQLVLHRWHVVAGAVKVSVIKPVDPLQGGQLDVV